MTAPFKPEDPPVGYGQYYIRMCGSIPLDAEETLRQQLVWASGDATMAKRMAIESASHSRLTLYFSIGAFLDAHAKYIERYSLEAAHPVVKEAQDAIRKQLSAMTDELDNIRNAARK